MGARGVIPLPVILGRFPVTDGYYVSRPCPLQGVGNMTLVHALCEMGMPGDLISFTAP